MGRKRITFLLAVLWAIRTLPSGKVRVRGNRLGALEVGLCLTTQPRRDYNFSSYPADWRGDDMVSFIHIADKNKEQSILRNGIKATKRRSGGHAVPEMPVSP